MMPPAKVISGVAAGLGALLVVASLLVWAFSVAILTEVTGRQSGHDFTGAIAGLILAFLWLELGGLVLLALFAGDMPKEGKIAALLLVPAACIASFVALFEMDSYASPFQHWFLVAPTFTPPLIVSYALWTLNAPLRARLPERLVSAVVFGGLAVICAALVPLTFLHEAFHNARVRDEAARQERWSQQFDSLKPDTPLAQWIALMQTGDYSHQDKALSAIRALARRQSDAEAMLDRDELPLDDLQQFALEATPTLCDKARASLRRQAAAIPQIAPNARPYSEIADKVSAAASALDWLAHNGCVDDPEARAWAAATERWSDPSWDLERIKSLGDAREIQRIIDNDPASFAMLTPRSHLRAWLKFAYDDTTRAATLDGARKLDHRTADLAEMLGDSADQNSRGALLELVPELEVQATEPLCRAALDAVSQEFAPIYRPTDPRPYDSLTHGMGSAAFGPLKWLAGHGCAAEAQLTEAEAIVNAYQDSPARAAMLADLTALHHKP
jgi:hypothetical protein